MVIPTARCIVGIVKAKQTREKQMCTVHQKLDISFFETSFEILKIKMWSIVRRAGIEPSSLSFRASVLTISPDKLPYDPMMLGLPLLPHNNLKLIVIAIGYGFYYFT